MHVLEHAEAGGELSRLLDRVAAGEEVLIRRGGRTVARIVPAGHEPGRDEPRAAADAIRKMSVGVTLGGIGIRDLVNDGRR